MSSRSLSDIQGLISSASGSGSLVPIIIAVLTTFSSQKLKYDAFLQISYKVSQRSIVV
jgi:hypothetical protein